MKINKVIVFSLLVMLPIGIIVIISMFGENEYKLPVYFAEDSTAVEGGYKITKAHIVPDFKLLNQDGDTVTGKQLRGKIHVVDFFFTRCGSICPKMTTQLTRVQEEFAEDADFQIVSITVDPKNDTADVLKAYSKEYGANNTIWWFLTGTKDSIYALAQKGFFISAMEDEAHPVDFIHSEKLVLVDKEGWIRGYYDGTDVKEVDKLMTEIKVLQSIYAYESAVK